MDDTHDCFTFISLFSGIGGGDKGLEDAGMTCVLQVEIDPNAMLVLNHHWPNVKKERDVCNVSKKTTGYADLIIGGFPCQDLSVAGKREGLAGERSGLWFEFRRIVEDIRPEWVVVENVPGLLSSNRGRDFAIILSGLVKLGYGVAWRVLDAQYFGVAQRRRRVFVVGHLGDGRAAEVLFEPEGVQGDSPPSRSTGQKNSRDAASGTGVCNAVSRVTHRIQSISGTITEGFGARGVDSDQVANGNAVATYDGHNMTEITYDIDSEQNTSVEQMGTIRAHKSGGAEMAVARMEAFGKYIEDGTCSTLKKRDYKDATDLVYPKTISFQLTGDRDNPGVGTYDEIHPTLAANPMSDRGAAIAFTERTRKDGRNVECQDELAYALTNPGSGGRTHSRQIAGPFGVRRLTPTECERLQGFPDGWTLVQRAKRLGKKAIDSDLFQYLRKQFISVFGRDFADPDEFRILSSDSSRYKQCGNAMCVPVVTWIGQRIGEIK